MLSILMVTWNKYPLPWSGHLQRAMCIFHVLQENPNEFIMTLWMERAFEQYFQTYTFIATNDLGTSEYDITLQKGKAYVIYYMYVRQPSQHTVTFKVIQSHTYQCTILFNRSEFDFLCTLVCLVLPLCFSLFCK